MRIPISDGKRSVPLSRALLFIQILTYFVAFVALSPRCSLLAMSTNNAEDPSTAARTSGRVRRPTAKAAAASAASRKRRVVDSDDDVSDASADEQTDNEVGIHDPAEPAPLQTASSTATIVLNDDDDDNTSISVVARKFNKRFNVAENTNDEVLGEYFRCF